MKPLPKERLIEKPQLSCATLLEKSSIELFIQNYAQPQYWRNSNIQKETTPKDIKMTPEADLLVRSVGLEPGVTRA
jgi:hypothetical protein